MLLKLVITPVLWYSLDWLQDNCKDNETNIAESFSDRINEVQSVINTLEAIEFGNV